MDRVGGMQQSRRDRFACDRGAMSLCFLSLSGNTNSFLWLMVRSCSP